MSGKDKSRGFLELTQKGCAEVYPHVRDNAEKHYRVSEILAAGQEYPGAAAHLVLGTEELLKAFALLMESKGFALRKIEGYRKIFYSHQARHSIIKEAFAMVQVFKSFMDIPERKKGEHFIMHGLKALVSLGTGAFKASSHYQWWDKADELKQKSFYVDYADKVVLPSEITEQVFKEALGYTEEFRKDIRVMVLLLEEAEEKQLIALRNTFETTKMAELLGESINRR